MSDDVTRREGATAHPVPGGRRIVAARVYADDGGSRAFAICDDGSVWSFYCMQWSRIAYNSLPGSVADIDERSV